ncbi:MAG TPA: hypothetical protein VFO01_13585 [Trebonia sp.]|nr:hypothetical protein [Trebonia sp.]
MGRVEFHAVGTDFLGIELALDEGALEVSQVGLRGGAAERLARVREAGRAQRDEVRVAVRVPAVVDRALVSRVPGTGTLPDRCPPSCPCAGAYLPQLGRGLPVNRDGT